MPVTEIERRELVNRLVATIGEESTETLMQCLLTEGRDQLATKDDLKAFATKDDLKAFATKDDLKALENTLRAELASKDDLKAFATKDDLKMLEKVLRAESNERFAQLEALINTAMGKQMRIYVGLLVGVMLTVWGTSLVYAFG